ncbi:MAG: universal stress protein [Pseudomonadota bacterium]
MSSIPLYIVAIDGSEASLRAEKKAIELAKVTGATVRLSHIIQWTAYAPVGVEGVLMRPVEKDEEERHAREEILEKAKARVESAGVSVETFYTWGHPAHVLKGQAEEQKADMIIVGRKGRSNLAEMIMGSVSNGIAHLATVPVLLVP